MPVFDLDTIQRVLLEEPFHQWEGTCELCNFPNRKLSDVGGVWCCDQCRNTITARLKENNHPFTEARVTMDPKLRGQGVPGQKTPLPGNPTGGTPTTESLAKAIKAYYGKELPGLRPSLKTNY